MRKKIVYVILVGILTTNTLLSQTPTPQEWTKNSISVTKIYVNRYLNLMYINNKLPTIVSGSYSSWFNYTFSAGIPQVDFLASSKKIKVTYPFSGNVNITQAPGYSGSANGRVEVSAEPVVRQYADGSMKLGIDLASTTLVVSIIIEAPAGHESQFQLGLTGSDIKGKLFGAEFTLDSFFPIMNPILTVNDPMIYSEIRPDLDNNGPFEINQDQFVYHYLLGLVLKKI